MPSTITAPEPPRLAAVRCGDPRALRWYEVGAVHPACGDANADLAFGGLRIRPLHERQRLAQPTQRHGAHDAISLSSPSEVLFDFPNRNLGQILVDLGDDTAPDLGMKYLPQLGQCAVARRQ
jgi:hypothetical protein